MTETKNDHLEHIEDWALNAGAIGAADAIAVMRGVLQTLSGQSSSVVVTEKWDGSLALFAGVDPASKKFFVGTKAVLSKNPKLNFTDSDIITNHPNNPELQDILKIALKHIRKLGIRTVLQGDVIFVRSWIKTGKVDGEEMLLFKPNTIVYGVPLGSNLAQDIMASHIGVVWHTEYSGGKTVPEMKAKLNPNVSNLVRTEEVWFDDATLKNVSPIVNFTKKEQQQLNKLLSDAGTVIRSYKNFLDELSANSVSKHIKAFDNSLIRSGKRLNDKSVAELIDFLDVKYKSQRGKDSSIGFLQTNKKAFLAVLKHRQAIDRAKVIILNKLRLISTFSAFVETSDGFRVGSQEGFVALASESGKVVKLVDRLNFSRLNFSRHLEKPSNVRV